ncbi:ArsR/SmtB family transcription factor [Nocardia coffeae]|uniref:ArsR/SmtB family transcription factor n=1 Tax=Nocardia coffeae TaxID=2873381 RepID=UPI001F43EA4E|nr:metalloregulator ArsR/SmtB family transcription factor [Nocardia coffeae]
MQDLVQVFKALADPVRLDLLRRIAAVPQMPCTDLVDESHVSASTVSYHVKVLRTAGLVDVRKEGRNFFYTYRPATAHHLAAALDELGAAASR